MWDFLSELLKHSGSVAVAFAMLALGVGFALRSLWNANQELQERLQLTQEKNIELQKDFADRLNALQEKRVDEARMVTEQVLTHAASVDQSVSKLDNALDVLINTLRD